MKLPLLIFIFYPKTKNAGGANRIFHDYVATMKFKNLIKTADTNQMLL
jgi:hypothetical protein